MIKSIEPGDRPMVLLGQVLDTHELALYSIGLVKADLRLFISGSDMNYQKLHMHMTPNFHDRVMFRGMRINCKWD